MIELDSLKRPKNLPQWREPPLDEVAIAVQFNDVHGWKTVHYGLLLERLKALGLGETEDKGTISETFEVFGKRPVEPPPFQFLHVEVQLPRVWYKSSDGHRLAQVQSNRFIYNWRKIENEGVYPRLNVVFPEFWSAFCAFRKFLEDNALPSLAINQCELSYFNNIPLDNDESFEAGLARIFKVWSGAIAPVSTRGAAIEPEIGNFSSQYIVRADDGNPIARLHAQAIPAAQGNKRMIRCSIIFRGPKPGHDDQSMVQYFATGRESIVRLFDSLVTDEMHRAWGRHASENTGGPE